MPHIYLDYAASTPVAPEALASMQPYFSDVFGNPSSLHWFGQEASAAIFRSREIIAAALGCHYGEIIFTGSATEANNLALRGMVNATWDMGHGKPRIITSTIEHESVLETCRSLEDEGVEVVYIPVNRDGIVDLAKLKAALNDRTVLVSIMHANNEIGVIQPIVEIAKIIAGFKSSYKLPTTNYPLLHTDAAQSFQYLPCRVDELGVDMLTLSGQKMYGPKGIGALYVHRAGRSTIGDRSVHDGVHHPSSIVQPVITGSGQERGLRAGTENTPLIVGFGKAVELAERLRGKEAARVKKLRDYFVKCLMRTGIRAEINGTLRERLPNNINVYFPGHSAGDIVIALDLKGVATSPGAACRSRAAKESYVIRALGYDSARAARSVRFSLGRAIAKKEVDATLKILEKIVK